MKRDLCVLLLVCVAAVLVQSKTSIEHDENGDEIEVKRFYIEGRQVNGGRRQCVETRRKRQASYNDYNQANANEASTGKKKTEELELSPTTPPSGIDTVTSEDDNSHRIGLIGVMDDSGQHIGVNGDDDVEDLEDTYHGIPIVAHKLHKQPSSSSQSVSATVAGSNGIVVVHTNSLPKGNPQTQSAAVAGSNGIVVVHTNSLPKVNPQTHAVFQLMPVQAPASTDSNDYDDADIDNSQLLYEEEISPVSTTAIWSTGADDDLDNIDDHNGGDHDGDYDGDGDDDDVDDDVGDEGDVDGADYGEDDYDLDEEHHIATKRPKSKPAKGSSRPVKTSGGSKKKKQKQKKKRPSTHKRRRPGNKNNKRLPGKRGMGGSNTRRRPSTSKQRRRPADHHQFTNRVKADRNNNQNNGFQRKGNRRVNANLANRDINRKKTNKLDAVNQGTNTYTKTETLTQTGTANDEKDVNCIIIHKDPPTTQRPFWAILGRDANGGRGGNGAASAGRHFGKRKRVNLRLAA